MSEEDYKLGEDSTGVETGETYDQQEQQRERLLHEQVVSLLDDLWFRESDGSISIKERFQGKLRAVVKHLARPDNTVQYAHYLIGSLEKVQHNLLPVLLQYRDNEDYVRHIAALITEIMSPVGPEITDAISRRRQQRQIKRALQKDHYVALIHCFAPQLKSLLTRHAATPTEDIEHVMTYLGVFQLILLIDDDLTDPNVVSRHCHDIALQALHSARFFKVLSALAMVIHLIGHIELAKLVLELLSFALKFEKPHWFLGVGSHDNHTYSNFTSINDTMVSKYSKRLRVAIDVDTEHDYLGIDNSLLFLNNDSNKQSQSLLRPKPLDQSSQWRRNVLNSGNVVTPASTMYAASSSHGGNKVQLENIQVGRIYTEAVLQHKKASERYENAAKILQKDKENIQAHNEAKMTIARSGSIGGGGAAGGNGADGDGVDPHDPFAMTTIGPNGEVIEMNFDLDDPSSLLAHHPTRLFGQEGRDALALSLQRVGGNVQSYFADYEFLQDSPGEPPRSYYPPSTINTVNDIFTLITEGHLVDLDYIKEQERQKKIRREVRKYERAIYKLQQHYDDGMDKYNEQYKMAQTALLKEGAIQPGEDIPEEALRRAKIIKPTQHLEKITQLRAKIEKLLAPPDENENDEIGELTPLQERQLTMAEIKRNKSKQLQGDGSLRMVNDDNNNDDDDDDNEDTKLLAKFNKFQNDKAMGKVNKYAMDDDDNNNGNDPNMYDDDDDGEGNNKKGKIDQNELLNDTLDWPFLHTSTSSSLLFFVFNTLEYDKTTFEIDELLFIERVFVFAWQCLSYWRNLYISTHGIDLVKMMIDKDTDDGLYASSALNAEQSHLNTNSTTKASKPHQNTNNASNSDVQSPPSPSGIDSITMDNDDNNDTAKSKHITRSTRQSEQQHPQHQRQEKVKLIGAQYPKLVMGEKLLIPEQLELNNIDIPNQQHTPFSTIALSQHSTPSTVTDAMDVPIKRMKHPKPLVDFCADQISFIFNEQIIGMIDSLLTNLMKNKAYQSLSLTILTYVREFLETLLLIECCGDYTSRIHATSLRIRITLSYERFIWLPKLLWRCPWVPSSDVVLITQLMMKLLVFMNREQEVITRASQYQAQALRLIESDFEATPTLTLTQEPLTIRSLYGVDSSVRRFETRVVTHFTNDYAHLPAVSFDGLVSMQFNNMRLFDVLGHQCFNAFSSHYTKLINAIEKERNRLIETELKDLQKKRLKLQKMVQQENSTVSSNTASLLSPLKMTSVAQKKPTGPLTTMQKQYLRRQQAQQQFQAMQLQEQHQLQLKAQQDKRELMGKNVTNVRSNQNSALYFEQLQLEADIKEKEEQINSRLEQLRQKQLSLLKFLECLEKGTVVVSPYNPHLDDNDDIDDDDDISDDDDDGMKRKNKKKHKKDKKSNKKDIAKIASYDLLFFTPDQNTYTGTQSLTQQQHLQLKMRFNKKMDHFRNHTTSIKEFDYLSDCIPTGIASNKLHVTHLITCLKNYKRSSPLLLYSLLSFINSLCFKYGRFSLFFNVPTILTLRNLIQSFPLAVTQQIVTKDPITHHETISYLETRNENVYFWSVLNFALKLTQSMYTRADPLLPNSIAKSFFISTAFNYSQVNWTPLVNPNGYFKSRHTAGANFFYEEGSVAYSKRGEGSVESYLSRLALDDQDSKYRNESDDSDDDDVMSTRQRENRRLQAHNLANEDSKIRSRFSRAAKKVQEKQDEQKAKTEWFALEENQGKNHLDWTNYWREKTLLEKLARDEAKALRKQERERELIERKMKREEKKKSRGRGGGDDGDDDDEEGPDEITLDSEGNVIIKKKVNLDEYEADFVLDDDDADEIETTRRKERKQLKKTTPKKDRGDNNNNADGDFSSSEDEFAVGNSASDNDSDVGVSGALTKHGEKSKKDKKGKKDKQDKKGKKKSNDSEQRQKKIDVIDIDDEPIQAKKSAIVIDESDGDELSAIKKPSKAIPSTINLVSLDPSIIDLVSLDQTMGNNDDDENIRYNEEDDNDLFAELHTQNKPSTSSKRKAPLPHDDSDDDNASDAISQTQDTQTQSQSKHKKQRRSQNQITQDDDDDDIIPPSLIGSIHYDEEIDDDDLFN